MGRVKNGFTKKDTAALFDEYVEMRCKIDARMVTYFDLREIEGHFQAYSYREAYHCGPDTPDKEMSARAIKLEKTESYKQMKTAYQRWKAVDTERYRRAIEQNLFFRATVELGDAMRVDPKTNKPRFRQYGEMGERARKGLSFRLTGKGPEYSSGNRDAAAAQLSRMNGWEAPKEISVFDCDMSGEIKIGFDDDEEDDGNNEDESDNMQE